jgi:DNA-binding transcriptional LysR family regulator
LASLASGESIGPGARDFANPRILKTFDSVASLESFSRASTALRLSQPAVTRAMAKLEREIGFPLFRRSHSGTVLTETGAILHRRTRRFFDQTERAAAACLGTTSQARLAAALARLTLSHLQVLAAIATAGSLDAAAEAVGMSANHLRRVMRSLERVMGGDLVRRSHGATVLTARGADFARGVLVAEREIESGLAEAVHHLGLGVSRVTVGALPAASTALLASPLHRLSAEHPGTCVEVIDGVYEARLRLLRNGALDMMFAHLEDGVPDDVAQEALIREDYVAVVRAGHPLLKAGNAGLAQLRAQLRAHDWIMPEQGGRRVAFERLFADPRTRPKVTLETYSRSMIRAMLLESDRVGILSRSEVRLDARLGLLRTINALDLGRAYTIALLTRRDWLPTPVQARLVTLIRAHAHKLGEKG